MESNLFYGWLHYIDRKKLSQKTEETFSLRAIAVLTNRMIFGPPRILQQSTFSRKIQPGNFNH